MKTFKEKLSLSLTAQAFFLEPGIMFINAFFVLNESFPSRDLDGIK